MEFINNDIVRNGDVNSKLRRIQGSRVDGGGEELSENVMI